MRAMLSALLSLFLILSLSIVSFAFEPQFSARIDYKSLRDVSMSTTILVADFDGDGDEDIFDGIGMQGIYITFNNSDGTLSPQTYRGSADEVDVAAIADIDNDGDIDLITGHNETKNDTSYVVTVHLNDGSGYFGAAYSIELDKVLDGLHMIDMDGDGDTDLIVRFTSTSGAILLLNDGSGNFSASGIIYPFPNHVWTIEHGDLDSDGDLDLVVGRIMVDTILVYANNGDGSLAPPVGYACLEGGPGISVVDMDADGHLDIVATEDYVVVLLNQKDGTFESYVEYDMNSFGGSVITADFNGDSYPDVLVESLFENQIAVLQNRGDGSLEPAVYYGVGMRPWGLGVLDLNGDGIDDIVAGSLDCLSTLTNRGDGTFVENERVDIGQILSSVAAQDLDADGDLDLIATKNRDNQLVVSFNQGDGSYDTPVEYPTGLYPGSICTVDLDLDGDIDLVTTNRKSDDISVFFNNGNGTFGAAETYPAGDGPCDVIAADVDNDGDLDLCVSNSPIDAMSVLINDGTAHFGNPSTYPMGGAPTSIHAADFDGDGFVDLATSNSGYYDYDYNERVPSDVSVSFNLGDGTFGPEVAYPNNPDNNSGYGSIYMSTDITSFDIDNDGDLDLVVSSRANLKGVAILLNEGGSFVFDRLLESHYYVTQFLIQDLDGDGNEDLVAANFWHNNVTVFTNAGDGEYGLGVTYGVDTRGRMLCAGDIDGDGHVDLVVASNYDGSISPSISILYNTGAGGQLRNCCGQFTTGLTGNIDCDSEGRRNLADITRLIDHVYITKADLCCEKNGNIDGDSSGNKNLADITRLIDHVYISKSETAPCQ